MNIKGSLVVDGSVSVLGFLSEANPLSPVYEVSTVTKTTSYSMVGNEGEVIGNSASALTVTLPQLAGAANGQMFIITQIGAGSVTVACFSGDHMRITGNASATTKALASAGKSIIVMKTGSGATAWTTNTSS